MRTHEIRQRFVQYFSNRGHTVVPSAPLPYNDPGQLFVIAGMVPFVPYFLGERTADFTRATSIQKCVRTLDIDEVGITTRHNTFFEMAGNFSFGDYFKKEAIEFAWGFLTGSLAEGGLAIEPEKLWVTVYRDDDEAASLWSDTIGVPAARIQRRGKKDNYWSMGFPGPAGPCSEIFYDRGPEYGIEGGPEADEDRYIEIWNLVFMEKLRGQGTGKESFEIIGDLPQKNIDTGMGIERVAFLLQGVDNVYESDLLKPVLDTVSTLTGIEYGNNKESDRHMRVIADHTRTSIMLISDGIIPGNEGRGYIVRRLLRRIIRSAKILGAHTSEGVGVREFIAASVGAMSDSYPVLTEQLAEVTRVAVGEEQAFLRTVQTGTKLFENTAAGNAILSGSEAFTLHDTYGFPIDLTLEMAKEAGIEVDYEGFIALMNEQKQRAKHDAQTRKTGVHDNSIYRPFLDAGETLFTGYDELESIGSVIGLVHNGHSVTEAHANDTVELIVNRTPLYAESGGQMPDRGLVTNLHGAAGQIVNVQKLAKTLWLHTVEITHGVFTLGDEVTLSVDELWRHQASQAHSATHLVHAALRTILGPHAVQAGSMNKPGYMRFDFRWNQKIDEAERRDIEQLSNQAVDDHHHVNTVITDLESAKAMGALALFGENYGSQVRVVEIGGPFSMELCGGTHVDNSALVGPINIVSESSVGSGVRRVEALIGMEAYEHNASERALVSGLATILKSPKDEVLPRVEQLLHKIKEAEKDLAELRISSARKLVGEAVRSGQDNQTGIFVPLPAGTPISQLRSLTQYALGLVPQRAVVIGLVAVENNKAGLVVGVSSLAREAGFHAGELVGRSLEILSGKGGGKADIAQGTGTRTSPEAIAAVEQLIIGL